MKNMKILTTAVLCLLLSFSMGATAMAESITSPDGQLKLDFSVNAQGEPCNFSRSPHPQTSTS